MDFKFNRFEVLTISTKSLVIIRYLQGCEKVLGEEFILSSALINQVFFIYSIRLAVLLTDDIFNKVVLRGQIFEQGRNRTFTDLFYFSLSEISK